MGQFTFQIDDQLKLLSSNTYTDIERCALFAINNISRYVNWKGSMDFIVRIRPGTELTWSSADGLLPSLGQIGWNGKDWVNETLIEMQTGFDSDPKKPDAGCTIYLAKDGTIRNYGAPVWFDPSPSFDVNPDIPKSTHDFIGIFTHEVFHCFGLYGATSQWKSLVEKRGKNYFFTGSKTTSLLGGHLMLADAYSENNFPDHYGNTASIENNIARGLMFQWGNYERNRLDIGRVDLAILEDLGVEVLTYKGLPVTELSDVSPNVTGTPRSEAIYGDYHSNYLRGGDGNDTLDGAYGSDTIDGGAGLDTAVFSSRRESYLISSPAQDSVTVSFEGPVIAIYPPPPTDGTDTLINVERIQFSDRSFAMDLDSSAGNAARLLATVFGKDAVKNPTYAGIAISLFDLGYSKDQVSQAALNAALPPILGFNPKGKEVVHLIWKNLMGSSIPPSDVDNTNLVSKLGDLIDHRVITAAQLVTLIADLDLTAQVIDLVGLSKTGWEYIPYGG